MATSNPTPNLESDSVAVSPFQKLAVIFCAVLSKMSEQVLFTIIKEALRHGRFDSHRFVEV